MMIDKPSCLLTVAHAKILTPEQWCQSHMARDASHQPVADPRDPEAVRWCAKGALLAVLPEEYTKMPEEARIVADRAFSWLAQAAIIFSGQPAHHQFSHDPSYVNDFKDHATVLAMYQQAVELATVNED